MATADLYHRAMAGLLVTPAWLAERLGEVRVLDVRGEVANAEPRVPRLPRRYREGHVPGAVFADWRTPSPTAAARCR